MQSIVQGSGERGDYLPGRALVRQEPENAGVPGNRRTIHS